MATSSNFVDDFKQAFSWGAFAWWGLRSAIFLAVGAGILYGVGKDLISESNQGMRQAIQTISDSLTREVGSLTSAQQENTRQLSGLTAQVAAVGGKLDMLISFQGQSGQQQQPAPPRPQIQQQNFTVPPVPFDRMVTPGPIEIDLPKDGARFNAKVFTAFLAQTGALKDLPKGVTVFVPIDTSEIKDYIQTIDKDGRQAAWKYMAKTRIEAKALEAALKDGGTMSYTTMAGTEMKFVRSGAALAVWQAPGVTAKIVDTTAYGENIVHFIDVPIVK